MAAKYCTECGHQKSSLDRFCGKCGHKEGGLPPSSHVVAKTPIKIRLRSEMNGTNVASEDEGGDIDEVPQIAKLDITVEGGNLENGYGCRKFKIDDLLK